MFRYPSREGPLLADAIWEGAAMCAKPLATAWRQAPGAEVPAHSWRLWMSMQVASSPTRTERVHWQAGSCKPPFWQYGRSYSLHRMSRMFPSPSHHSLKQKGRSPAKFNGEAFVDLSGTTRLVSNYEISRMPVRFPPVERRRACTSGMNYFHH